MNDLSQVRHCKITGLPKGKAGVEICVYIEEDIQGIISVWAGYQDPEDKYAEIKIPVSNVGPKIEAHLDF